MLASTHSPHSSHLHTPASVLSHFHYCSRLHLEIICLLTSFLSLLHRSLLGGFLSSVLCFAQCCALAPSSPYCGHLVQGSDSVVTTALGKRYAKSPSNTLRVQQCTSLATAWSEGRTDQKTPGMHTEGMGSQWQKRGGQICPDIHKSDPASEQSSRHTCTNALVSSGAHVQTPGLSRHAPSPFQSRK